jgi:cytochrome c551/c552
MTRTLIATALLALAMVGATVEAKDITLPADQSKLRPSALAGYEVAQQKCGICHSADYISYQPPAMTQTQWTAEVAKMKKAFGAPLSDTDIKLVGAYLAVTYGSAHATDPEVAALEAEHGTTAATAGQSLEPQALLDAHGCLGCHAADHKIVGPAFHDVGARYKADPNAEARVAASIRSGGAGQWGTVSMPPMPALTDAQAKALAAFVLKY